MSTNAFAYFEVPKALDTNPRYASLSVQARYLYAHLRDTLKLSIKNNWKDSNGYYVRMTRKNMAILLHCSEPTVRKFLRELRGIGLLREKRQGLTRSNLLYVQLLEGENDTTFQSRVKPASPQERKPDFTPERKPLSPNNPYPSKPYPNEPKKDGWKWFIKEGDKWFDRAGKLWQFIDGEVCPYIYGDELKANVAELLGALGMRNEKPLPFGV